MFLHDLQDLDDILESIGVDVDEDTFNNEDYFFGSTPEKIITKNTRSLFQSIKTTSIVWVQLIF